MYRFEVQRLPNGMVRFRATSAGRDGRFRTDDDLSELFAIPPAGTSATQAPP